MMAVIEHLRTLASCAQLKMWSRMHQMLAYFEGSVENQAFKWETLGGH